MNTNLIVKYTKEYLKELLLNSQNYYYLTGMGTVSWGQVKALYKSLEASGAEFIDIRPASLNSVSLTLNGGLK